MFLPVSRAFCSLQKATDNLWGELGPICEDGEISGPPQYSCNGTWKGKVKFGAPHVVSTAACCSALRFCHSLTHGSES
jgi:hypothetical protein